MLAPRSVAAFLPSMKIGAAGGLAGAGQRDADVGMLRFAGSVDDAAHHRDLQVLDRPVISFLPHRHVLAQIALDLLRQFLEPRSRSCARIPDNAATTGTN